MSTRKNRREFLHAAGLSATGLMAVAYPASGSVPEPQAGRQSTVSMGARLRQLLQQPGPIQAPSVYDVASARLAELNGFKAVFCGSSSVAQAGFGIPDDGILSMTDYVDYFSRMTANLRIPIVADVDDFGGNPLNVYNNTKLFERIGVAAVMFDDRALAERMRKKPDLLSKNEMVENVRAAVDARTDLVIIANTYAVAAKETLNQAIDRLLAFSDAGADMLNLIGTNATADWKQVIARVRKPMINAVGGAGGIDKSVGLKIEIYERPLDIALGALQRMYEELKATGFINEALKGSLSRDMRAKLTQDPQFDAIRRKYNMTP